MEENKRIRIFDRQVKAYEKRRKKVSILKQALLIASYLLFRFAVMRIRGHRTDSTD